MTVIRRTTRVPSHLMHRQDQFCNRSHPKPPLNESPRCSRSCKTNLRRPSKLFKFESRANRLPYIPSVSRTRSHTAGPSHGTSHLSFNKLLLFVCVPLCVRYYRLYSTFLLVLQVYVLFFHFGFPFFVSSTVSNFCDLLVCGIYRYMRASTRERAH